MCREREENEALNRVVHQRHQQDPFQTAVPQLPLDDIKMQAPPVLKPPPEQPAAPSVAAAASASAVTNRDAIRRSREMERRRRAEVGGRFCVRLCVSLVTACVSRSCRPALIFRNY